MGKKLSTINIEGLIKTYEVIWLHNKLGLIIVQEYVQGRNLRDRIDSRINLEIEESLSLAIRLCGNLEKLHKLGIAHCDVKPLNVLVSSSGKPILIDLGAARFFDETTPQNEIVVSIPYSSRKLMNGDVIDEQVDIYSLGITLIHMVVGFPSWTEKDRDSYDFSTEAVPSHKLSSVPSNEEIQEYLYLCLRDWRLRFIDKVLAKALCLNGEFYNNVVEFRQDLLNCLDFVKRKRL